MAASRQREIEKGRMGREKEQKKTEKRKGAAKTTPKEVSDHGLKRCQRCLVGLATLSTSS